MKRSRFTETQVVSILKEADAGMAVKEVCRRHGISDATFYKWKSKYGGLEASDLKRMREIEGELSQLKRMYADLAMENRALKDLTKKNSKAAREARRRAVSCRGAPSVDTPQMRMYRLVSGGPLPCHNVQERTGCRCHRGGQRLDR